MVCVAGPAFADVTSVAGGAFGVSAAVTVPVTGALGLAPSPSVVLPTTGGGPITRTAAKGDSWQPRLHRAADCQHLR